MKLEEYKGFIFDLDGVIWLGSQPIPGVAEAVNKLRASGRRIAFLTNNAGKHRSRHLEKLLSMGVEASLEEIVTSGSAAAQLLRKQHGPGRAFVMGTEELEKELQDAGHSLSKEDANFVVVGLDKKFSYEKLDIAFRNIRENKAVFVVCAENPTFLDNEGLHPGTGASAKALSYCSGKDPDLVTGKPHTAIMEIALEILQLPVEETVMVGDILAADIQAAINIGMETLFVLSGSDSREDIETTGIIPTHILDSVADISV